MTLNCYCPKGRGHSKKGMGYRHMPAVARVSLCVACKLMCRTRWVSLFPGPWSAHDLGLHLSLDVLSVGMLSQCWLVPWENISLVICFHSLGGNSEGILLSPFLTVIIAFICVPGSWEPEREHCNPSVKLERPREYTWQNSLHTPGFLSAGIPELPNVIHSLRGLCSWYL